MMNVSGQKRRLALATFGQPRPWPFSLLDEPTAGLGRRSGAAAVETQIANLTEIGHGIRSSPIQMICGGLPPVCRLRSGPGSGEGRPIDNDAQNRYFIGSRAGLEPPGLLPLDRLLERARRD